MTESGQMNKYVVIICKNPGINYLSMSAFKNIFIELFQFCLLQATAGNSENIKDDLSGIDKAIGAV